MWLENKVFKEDLEQLIRCEYIPWERLQDKTVLVTGATGLIGYNLVCGLIYANIVKKLNIHIVALVRNFQKAQDRYEEVLKDTTSLSFVAGTVEDIANISAEVDYIVHGAGPTASAYFINYPVDTIKTAVIGTMNMLELAKNKKVQGFVYLSSMEIYGAPKTEDVLSEEDLGYMNPLLVRNCYPESKRQCEALCAAYAQQYDLRTMSIRLAQTFGPGVTKDDARVFAEFARCAMEKRDIILLTDGSSKRCYLYTMDAVSAILTVLLKGEAGCAYNAGDPRTYCSVKEMAEMVAREIAYGRINTEYAEDEEKCKKFSPPHFYNLGVDKLKKLGWKSSKAFLEMYKRMMNEF